MQLLEGFFGGENVWTRLLLQRGLATMYIVAFLSTAMQWRGLLGERGLLPTPRFLERVSLWQTPSIFHLMYSDRFALVLAWAGVVISALALLGLTERFGLWFSVTAWALLYVLYLSFVSVGQTWYSFGWESILLEAGFFAIFLGSRDVTPPVIVIWIFRWLAFRIMFGAGMIKLRGDSCWHDLTCLLYHHETQPMPNPISWYAHNLPVGVHKVGVLFNHFIELIVPFGFFLPQPIAGIAGLLTVAFQGMLIVTGNFSWLNWLTLILAFSALNDGFLRRFLPLPSFASQTNLPAFDNIAAVLGVTVAVLSVPVIINLLSRSQLMNYNYNPFHLVGTYGAFGSITKERNEIIIEGTRDDPADPRAVWRPYEFKGKPGDPKRRPPQVAPYHLRLDWLMWFAAFSPQVHDVWFLRLVDKLLQNDRAVLGLLRHNPFPDRPPRSIRALYYRYHFTTAAERQATGAWWWRELKGEYLPPIMSDHSALRTLNREFEGGV